MTKLEKYIQLSRRLLAELNAKKQEIAQSRQPIAIVGMACRFPGGTDLSAFWRQLEEGGDAISQRRPGVAEANQGDRPSASGGSSSSGSPGGFVAGIDRFDAEFFQIAPVEARLMDPQQRMLLETSWLALEDAGIAPARLSGTRTGVYAGISTSDYWDLLAREGEGQRSL